MTGSRTESASRGLLARIGVTLYPGEAGPAWLLFLSFFLCVTFQYAAKTVRQATFVDSLGATQLPYAYLALALLSYPVALLYSRLARRVSRRHLAAGTFALTAGSLLVFWWFFHTPGPELAMAFYVWIGIVVALTLSQLWSLASIAFDARQAKRLFGFLGAGALLGGVAGGLTARFAAQFGETRDSLLVACALLVPVVVVIYRLSAPALDRSGASETADRGVSKDRREADGAQDRGSFAAVTGSPHLRSVALLVALVIVVSQIIDLQFNWAVEASTTNLADRTAFFGTFFSLMGVAAFVFQLAFTTRIHRLLGVGFALRVLPASLSAGTVGLFLAATLLPAALIPVALALKLTESGLRYSVDDSTRELLFLPVPAEQRGRVKTFLDLFVKRAAKGAAAVLLLPVTVGWITPLEAGWISLVLIAFWLALTTKITRQYIHSFRRGLQQKAVDSGSPINLEDVTTLEILVQSLGSPDPRQVLNSLDIMANHQRGHLVPPLLLYHEDEEVRCRTLQILAAEGRDDAAPLVERRLSDSSPAVRAEATRVLADLRHQDACDMMMPRLEATDPGVRAAAIACLTNYGDRDMRQRAEAALVDMTSDADPSVRIEGAHALGAITEPHFEGRLVRLLYDPEPRVVRSVMRAIQRRLARDGPNPLYLPTLISLLANRRLKHDARQALAAYGEDAIPALRMFMNDPEEPLWVRRAIPKTISGIASRQTAEVLIDSLDDSLDSFLRRKLLQAVDALDLDHSEASRTQKIRHEITVEARHYLTSLADLYALDPSAAEAVDQQGDPPGSSAAPLLVGLLAERVVDHRNNLQLLLGLVYDPRQIADAFRGLVRPELRANALEFLDCSLQNADKDAVLAAVGDAPLIDKLTRGERLFGIARGTRTATVLKHLSPRARSTSDAPFLAVGALHAVHSEELTDLYPVVDSLEATATDPFVLETAQWVSEQARRRGRRGA